jgi:dTDP-4-amino-4,6-dideoxygalactose transaminase
MTTSSQRTCLLDRDPVFDKPLHVGCPNIGDRTRLLARINHILDRRWLTNDGLFAQEFEKKIAALLGVKHCRAMCNGTIALEIAIRAMELRGEVILPSFTFIATAHALQWQEITPVFCDIDPRTYNVDPRRIEDMITPRTTGIIGVHLWGRSCDVEGIMEVARRYDLKVIFDAAHAFGCSHGGRMIGSFGNAEVFSFHATKFFNTFEGGAVVTNDDVLAEKIRLMKNFGFAGADNVIHIGTNGKMSEICAAMGLTGLESLAEFIETNRRHYMRYRSDLRDVPGIRLLEYDESETSNYQYIVVDVDEQEAGLNRDQLVEVLHAENVLARRYFYPGCHRMEPYASHFPHAGLLLPETERVSKRVMSLPTGTAISSDDVSRVCLIVREAVEQNRVVKEKLAAIGRLAEEPQLVEVP